LLCGAKQAGWVPMPLADYDRVPEEKTEFCPTEDGDARSFGGPSGGATGQMTRWIVKNGASRPVFISWVNTEGGEVSATDGFSKLSASSGADALLAPGKWRAVSTYQGHLFHVRAVGKDGNPGRLLLRHRAGMIAVRNPNNVPCAPAGVNDTAFFKVRPDVGCETGCHFLHKGFVNRVGCGVDVYWRGGGAAAPRACERFSFHLGNERAGPLSWEEWEAYISFESTYTTHRFVVRMAHDDSFVEEIRVGQDVVHDCPDRKLGVATTDVRVHPAVKPTTTFQVCRANETALLSKEAAARVAAQEQVPKGMLPIGAREAGYPGGIAAATPMSMR
jgi:hypothetical protein